MIRSIVEEARKDELSLENVAGGTFAINNVGMFDLVTGASIIDPLKVQFLESEQLLKSLWSLMMK
jgi:pyruvate/2-oxoglutarate dehydrogenase complex dihydrolipoamide acyltransferase (E2) component